MPDAIELLGWVGAVESVSPEPLGREGAVELVSSVDSVVHQIGGVVPTTPLPLGSVTVTLPVTVELLTPVLVPVIVVVAVVVAVVVPVDLLA